jgi:hypothetical protein
MYHLHGFEMSKPWHDMASEKLDPSDTIQKTYTCTLDKNMGISSYQTKNSYS